MRLRKISIQNVRSFLERTEATLDGSISILIGPNGGGKTNLLDAAVFTLRRYLFASMYAAHAPIPESQNRYEFRHNDYLDRLTLERNTNGGTLDQVIEVVVEVTAKDLDNMRVMQADAERLTTLADKKYVGLGLTKAKAWNIEAIPAGFHYRYIVVNGRLQTENASYAAHFLEYLQTFEMDAWLRDEFDLAPLTTPLVYLPVNRTANQLQSSVELAGYSDYETKRSNDAASSRSGTQIVSMAIGRMAQKYRLLLEKDKGTAATEFRDDPNLKELTRVLRGLGYEWNLETTNALKNHYDVRLTKQGTSFLVGAASSGERELLTYLFAIYALNVRDALIIVDEPELHLHPKWQKTLLRLFTELAETTGNQFLIATHSPTFVSPESIPFVSRVYSDNQRSRIRRLDASVLPESRHLLNIVNSQNNERLFFADEVILVEGLSDRIFFEAVLDHFGRSSSSRPILEIISVGGKGLFEAYGKLLKACEIRFSIVADLDYVEDIGSPEIKALFKIDTREVKKDVLENPKSVDGDTLVKSIDDAILSGSWGQAEDLWNYIKSRRRQIKPDLTASETNTLQTFIAEKQASHIFVLSRGSLEAYLPSGHSSKDLEKLIRLLGEKNFWEMLPSPARQEIQQVALTLLRGQLP